MEAEKMSEGRKEGEMACDDTQKKFVNKTFSP